ncbi:MAG TPA: hypothetical protein VNN80_01520 [Polyangiaceae bacterium]|nr:hypothetical protein [Polyangiaceae bacterium]
MRSSAQHDVSFFPFVGLVRAGAGVLCVFVGQLGGRVGATLDPDAQHGGACRSGRRWRLACGPGGSRAYRAERNGSKL